jgi:hypothetical protein
MSKRIATVPILLIVVAIGSAPQLGVCFAPVQLDVFRVMNEEGLEQFGTSVAVHDGAALVGVPGEDFLPGASAEQGSVYVYATQAPGSMAFAQKLIPPAPDRDDRFGHSVSLFGDTALIGAPEHGYGDQILNYGTAYIYQREPNGVWSPRAKFQEGANNWFENRKFGNSVSLWEATALVGAPADVAAAVTTGSAYVFNKNPAGNWSETIRLLASDRQAFDGFGNQVALRSATAIITAPNKSVAGAGVHSGQAYVFKRNEAGQWLETGKLRPDDATAEQHFGSILGSHDDLAVFAAQNAAYVFQENASGDWTQIAKLSVNGTIGGISVSNKQILIGLPFTRVNGIETGSALLFQRTGATTWTQGAQFFHKQNLYSGNFGYSVALTETRALVGDPAVRSDQRGAVYLFQTALAGDYNNDGEVGAADYVVWRGSFGQSGKWLLADGDGDGDVTHADYDLWRSHFGTTAIDGGLGSAIDASMVVPEVGACPFVLTCIAASLSRTASRRRYRKHY